MLFRYFQPAMNPFVAGKIEWIKALLSTRRSATWNSNDSFFYRKSTEWMKRISDWCTIYDVEWKRGYSATDAEGGNFQLFYLWKHFSNKEALMLNKLLTAKIGFIQYSSHNLTTQKVKKIFHQQLTERIQIIIICQSKWRFVHCWSVAVGIMYLVFSFVLFQSLS